MASAGLSEGVSGRSGLPKRETAAIINALLDRMSRA